MNLSEQVRKNIEARKEVVLLNKEFGMRWNFIASQIGMKYHSFANWKRGAYDFGKDRLEKIDVLLNKYKNLQ